MAEEFAPLLKIQPDDTLAEGREKINSTIKRVNDGKFSTVFVASDLRVEGKLFVSELITEQTSIESTENQFITLYDYEDEESTPVDTGDRGIIFKYKEDETVKSGFFGWSSAGVFKFVPEGSLSGLTNDEFTGTKGTIDASIQASDVLNVTNFVPTLSQSFVTLTTTQTITGQKTFSSDTLLVLNNSTQGNSLNHALRASRTLNSTDGVLIDGTTSQNLTADRTISVDSTVVRTLSTDQTILGTKTFNKIITSDVIVGTASFVTDGVYTLTNQNILGSKVFRRTQTGDGIRFWPQNIGTSDHVITISNSELLTANRTISLPDANVTLVSGTMVSTNVNQTIDSTKTFSQSILFSDSGTTKRGIQGTVGANDFWFVGGRAVAENEGYAEISTGNNASEPVYAKQYVGSPLSTDVAHRTFVILSTDGHTETFGYVKLGAQATSTDQAVRADRTISAGTGLSGGGNLTDNRTLSVNFSEVVRTSTDQTVGGVKTFTGTIVASDTILGNTTSADKLSTPRQINGISFDGTQNITVSAAVDGIFYESLQTVTQNYTVPIGKNALVIGPVEFAEGVEVDVSEGSTLVII
jgi:hypothetical protein